MLTMSLTHHKISCPLCGAEMSTKNYTRHLRSCNTSKNNYVNYLALDAGYNSYDTTYNKTLYHVIARTDNCSDIDGFMSHFSVYNDLFCHCGEHTINIQNYEQLDDRDCNVKHQHVHFVGSWLDVDTNKSRILNKYFNEKKSFSTLDITSKIQDLTQFDVSPEQRELRREVHFRLLKVIWYIQTVNGHHPKHGHKNEITFKNKYLKNLYIKQHSTANIWCAHQYYDYLVKQKLRYKIIQTKYGFDKSQDIAKVKVKMQIVKEQHPNIKTVTQNQLEDSYHKYLESTINYKVV